MGKSTQRARKKRPHPQPIHFPLEVDQVIRRIAKRDDRSINYTVNRIVREALEARGIPLEPQPAAQ